MELNPIAVAIPVFFLLILLELVVSWAKGESVYRFNDAITDLGCGIGEQVTGVFLKALSFGLYLWVFENWAPFHMKATSPGAWFVGIIGLDFLYYWWHRWSHEINFMWAGHVVHHQSQDYNLAVALRQAWFTKLTSAPIYAILAFVGVPPLVMLGSEAISLLYQFWIHTRLIGKMGPLEEILNTPSHHRVHHGVNPQYLDRNYAAILIIWDKVFGTFEAEDEPVVYGTVKPFQSWNPVWAQFAYWQYLLEEARAARTMTGTIKVWFKDPLWRPAGRPKFPKPPKVNAETFKKFDTNTPSWVNWYVLAHFPLVVALTVGALAMEKAAPGGLLAVMVMFTLITTYVFGLMFERRELGIDLEFVRLGGIALFLAVMIGPLYPALTALVILGLGGSGYLAHLGRPQFAGESAL